MGTVKNIPSIFIIDLFLRTTNHLIYKIANTVEECTHIDPICQKSAQKRQNAKNTGYQLTDWADKVCTHVRKLKNLFIRVDRF